MNDKLNATVDVLENLNFVKSFVAKPDVKGIPETLQNILIEATEDFLYFVGCNGYRIVIVETKNYSKTTGRFQISPDQLKTISLLSYLDEFEEANTNKYPNWKTYIYDAFSNKKALVEFNLDNAVIDFLKLIKSPAKVNITFNFNKKGAYLEEIRVSPYIKCSCHQPIIYTDINGKFTYYNFMLPEDKEFKISVNLNSFIEIINKYIKERIDFTISILENNVIKITGENNIFKKRYISFLVSIT